MPKLENKTALITGAGAGIGRATALLFAAEGARIAVVERNAEAGEETARLVQAQGGQALFIPTDVSEPDQVEAAVAQTVKTFGGLHVLHNNAGGSTSRDSRVSDAPIDEFWARIKIDLFGTWLGCRFGIPAVIASGGGAVINMTSIFALIGTHNKDSYTAAKGAISALTRSMAVEYAAEHVRVNAIAPGATSTERVLKMMANNDATNLSAQNQLFGMVTPEDVAKAALFLACDDSRSTTGHILSVDGGLTIS
ncbi:MAG: SDR family oxidoreductase [Burkholderiales bacterium]|uniref:SDR family NAD(P)-dependent oxidoreductase n=1 Tax=Ottowia sp. TaxID=1898956 RepID=UPI001AC9819C|nr:SDR family oxidoreductase [Ottowia sp.]MBN9404489.1 SDR family oxidoreductase [Burkholderiales bacterium]MBS0402258.1 SDR family oxidoreductase [Pseudomonadota bacterium]MBS0414585.1 SDR family oxidoreductase [Pseudomonadota bacterium]HMN56775.1 SDR family oxidoreductase [Ottowia sp.]